MFDSTLRSKPICRTCEFWDARYPQNRDLGVCLKAGALIFFPSELRDPDLPLRSWHLKAEMALLVQDAYDQTPPTSDVALVRTVADFGCSEHTSRGGHVKTRDLPHA